MKTKFFKGISAAFALVMVALATTFTACEKEEFNVDVKPANAQAVISPIVLFTDAEGHVTDVTNQSTFEPTVDKLVFVGNPALSAKTQVVKATYVKDGETYSSSINVTVPALLAGQYANITPTIMLQAKNAPVEIDVTTDPKNILQDKTAYVDNVTMYYWDTTRKYTKKEGKKLVENSLSFEEGISQEAKLYIVTFAADIKKTYKETQEEVSFKVLATSRTALSLTYDITETTYTFNLKDAAKAAVKVGSVKTEDYTTTTVTTQEGLSIPGHGHSHGHGHGHGNDANAGGGIVWAD